MIDISDMTFSTDENGNTIIHRESEDTITFCYYYHPLTKVFIKRLTLGTGDVKLPQHCTVYETPEILDGKCAIYDSEQEAWNLFDDDCFTYDHVTKFYSGPAKRTESSDVTNCVDVEPPGDFELSWWDGSAWQDRPVPATMYGPVFDSAEGIWSESLAGQNLNDAIDKETFDLIKDWCVEQGKCEEWYLNKGIINGSSDSDFVAYKTERESIIAAQAAKKV